MRLSAVESGARLSSEDSDPKFLSDGFDAEAHWDELLEEMEAWLLEDLFDVSREFGVPFWVKAWRRFQVLVMGLINWAWQAKRFRVTMNVQKSQLEYGPRWR